MSVAIKVENLSKAYQLGEIGTGTISHDLERWFAKLCGKEDPFLKIGEANDRTTKGTSNTVWSLKDINFEISQGDAVGIIGRNGAGKSTLLKILSRVTSPTTGKLSGKGRIASLLEVGTGFHPELTGKENIYLNGAILGMRNKEIKKHFDAIVEFAGVERYIDTPVKRYSSGMYVRLAFAVAAHLESEILIVDEVLAVGDAEFQKKCLGRMKDVSLNDGRTVLFVSHNMAAVSALCVKSMLLQNGSLLEFKSTEEIIEKYITIGKSSDGELYGDNIKVSNQFSLVAFRRVALLGKNGPSNSFGLNEDISCEVDYEVLEDTKVFPSIHILDKYGTCILASINSDSANIVKDPFYNSIQHKGIYTVKCSIPKFLLNNTRYSISIFLAPDNSFSTYLVAEEVLSFDVHETGEMSQEHTGTWIGQIRPKLQWSTIKN